MASSGPVSRLDTVFLAKDHEKTLGLGPHKGRGGKEKASSFSNWRGGKK